MAITNAAVEQMRSLLNSGDLSEQQVDELMRLGRLIGPKPAPSGFRGGEPFWTSSTITEWSKTAKRSRADATVIATRAAVLDSGRSLMAKLTGRQRQRDMAAVETLDEVALDVMSGKATPEDVEARLEAIGATVADLDAVVTAVEARQELIRQQQAVAKAKSEVADLEREIAGISAEIKQATQPLRARITDLHPKLTEARQRSTGDLRLDKKLRDSAPEWLRAKAAEVAQQLTQARDESERLNREDTSLKAAVRRAREARSSVVRQVQLLAAAVAGDHEAKQKREQLNEQDRILNEQLASQKDRETAINKRRKELNREIQELQARAAEVDRVMITAPWPVPSDLED
ncbi:Chromosome partition protein Smc [Posidoniimonas corsicana]|uniref:Chromosome partition protein Smc n=1 Tax=Posidoniimonas corsicana TaxID=1938618 RepID=A0A5C5VD19_9BACT|nr:hypothetical protein [Posidoniimonas corsicana]TWT35870.1 Chromosome partition protein Smc [Posidoniimonas corsicana]